MSVKQKRKLLLDTVMTALLPVLMTYSLAGEAVHEWLGIGMPLLSVLHHLLNAPWHRRVFSGRYTLFRAVNRKDGIQMEQANCVRAMLGEASI